MNEVAASGPTKTRTIKVPRTLYRDFEVEIEPRADGGDSEVRLYPLSFSSEAPVRRFSWDTFEEYNEVLSHEAGDVDLSRAQNGLPLIKSHQRLLHFGSVNGIALDEKRKRLQGVASFSSIPLGQEQETMLREGHTKTVSVGYQVLDMKLVSKDETGLATYRCRWMPLEVSTEPVPADFEVGFARAREEARTGATDVDLIKFEIQEPVTEGERAMSPGSETPPAAVTTPASGTQTPTAAAPPAAITGRDRTAEAAEIMDICQAYGVAERAAAWFREGLSPDQVSREILKSMRRSSPGQPAAEMLAQLPEKERRKYSYSRAIMEGVLHKDDQAYSGLEGEVHREIAKTLPENYRYRGGILVPMRLHDPAPRQRTMDSLTSTKGTELVFEEAGELIEMLRNRSFVAEMGARILTGLTAPIAFPKVVGGLTIYWVAENPGVDVADSDMTFGTVLLTPHTMQGTTAFSRQLLMIAAYDTEAMVREDLATAHALAIDRAALHGSGIGAEPTGIYSAPDVQPKSMSGAVDFTELVAMIGLVADKNAQRGSLGWMTSPLMAAKLMATLEFSAAGAMPIWTGTMENGRVAGYPARATNQVSKTLGAGSNEYGIIFGNWNDLIIGFWGALELIVDPYRLKKQGLIEVTSFQMADVVLRHGESFAKATGATLA